MDIRRRRRGIGSRPPTNLSRRWPSTARRDRLIVKEFELDPLSDVWIVVDMFRGVHHDAGTFEWRRQLQEMDRQPPWTRKARRLDLPPSTEEYAVTVKGAELPAHMPQVKRSLELIYAVNPFGADHQSSEHDPMYVPLKEGETSLYLPRLAKLGLTSPQRGKAMNADKVKFAFETQKNYSFLDTAALCQFVWGPAWTLFGPEDEVTFMKAVTGWDVTLEEIQQVGERRINMMRAFNAREGFDRKQDKLPKKFFKALQGSGPTAGVAIDPAEFEGALDMYYQLLNWTADGLPTRTALSDLGIEWVADKVGV